MAWSRTDLDNVEAAIVTAAVAGFAELSIGDKVLRRYTLKELLDLRAAMKAAIEGASRATYATHFRG